MRRLTLGSGCRSAFAAAVRLPESATRTSAAIASSRSIFLLALRG